MSCPYCQSVYYPGQSIVAQIMCEAHRLTDIPPRALRGPERMQRTAYTRFAIMRAARDAGLSFPAIGKALNRDHTTVIHGIRRADELIAADPGFAALVKAIAWHPHRKEAA